MTIRHLEVFIKVANLLSISKAAKELCVAQPSVSQTIKELEEYYNVILFERISHKLKLTEEGNLLLIKAKEVVSNFDEFESLARNKRLIHQIKIGATLSFGYLIFPMLHKSLNELYNNINISLYVDRPSVLEEKILKGELDFAFSDTTPDTLGINSIEIGEDNLIAIINSENNSIESIELKDINNYDILIREEGSLSRTLFDNEINKLGIKLKSPKIESISNDLIINQVINNMGIGIVPHRVANRYINQGLIREVELDKNITRKLFVITNSYSNIKDIIKKVLDTSVDIFRNMN